MAEITVAELVATLEARTAQFEREMRSARDEIARIEGATDSATDGTGRLSGAMGTLKTALIAAAATGGAMFLKNTLDMAVAAEEAASAFATTFGPATQDMTEFVEESANMMGFATHELEQMSAVTGNVIQGLGGTEQESAQLSQRMVTLAGDVASFSNAAGGAPAVLHALQSALTGEREALKTYGIVVTEAEVQQRALNMTNKASVSELTALDKALATVEIAYDRAGKAVGDLERTQDSTANQMRELNAVWKEAQVAIGEALIPAVEELLPILKELLPALGDIVAAVVGLAAPILQALAPGLEALAPLVQSVSQMFQALLPVINDVFGALAGVIRLFAELTTSMTNLTQGRSSTVPHLMDKVREAMELSRDEAGNLTGEFENFDKAMEDASEGIEAIVEMFEEQEEAEQALIDSVSAHEEILDKLDMTQGRAEKSAADLAAATDDLTRQHQAVRDAALAAYNAERELADQRLAALDPLFAMHRAEQELAAAEATLTDLKAQGKEGTKEYQTALLNMIRAQGEYNVAQQEMQAQTGASTGAVLALGDSANLSESDIRSLLDWIRTFNSTPIDPKVIQFIVEVTGDDPPSGGQTPRQHGGPVRTGMPYLVGEVGPELFIPDTSGYVMPNSSLNVPTAPTVPAMMGAAATINNYVSVNGNVLTERSFQDLVQEALLRVQRRNRTTGIR